MKETIYDADYYINQGETKRDAGEYEAAILDYDTAIRLTPDDAHVYALRGIAKKELGDHPSALLDFDTAIKLDARAGIYYYLRGQVKATLKQYETAISDFDTALKLMRSKQFAIGYCERGLSKYHLSKYESAISDFDMEIRQITNHAEAYYYRALAKIELTQIDEAEQDLRTALKYAPKEGDVQLKNEIENALRLINT